jgi:hypothetical protein
MKNKTRINNYLFLVFPVKNKWMYLIAYSETHTWCDPNGGLYRSSSWTPLFFWTQPTSIRISNTDTEEKN